MPVDGFSYTKGTPKQFSRSDLEKPVTREFCAECGTHMVTRPVGLPAVVVKVGTLDDPTQFGTSQMAIYTVDKQVFHQIPEGVPRFERLAAAVRRVGKALRRAHPRRKTVATRFAYGSYPPAHTSST